MKSNHIAAIDIGTNSAHLVIASIDELGHLQIADTEKVVLRLGEAFDGEMNITKEAIDRTAKAILHMKEVGHSYQPIYRVVATHAVRESQNSKEFIDTIEAQTGLTVEIVDGLEEARLISVGIQAGFSFPSHETFLGIDIGGGSTEVIVTGQEEIQYISSTKLGAVVLTKQMLAAASPSFQDIIKLQDHIEMRLGSFHKEVKHLRYTHAIACSGTAKSLANIHANKFKNMELLDSNGYSLPVDDIRKIYRELISLRSPKKIRNAFPIDQSRAEILIAGTAILLGYSTLLGVSHWIVSTYGLREGLVIDTASRIAPLENYSNEDIRWHSVKTFAHKLSIDPVQAENVTLTAQGIYDQLEGFFHLRSHGITYLSDRELLSVAAWLYESGKFIGFPRYHKHSYYIISNSKIMGFTQEEKEMIGLIARYHRKGIAATKRYHCRNLSPQDLTRVNFLAAVLRMAVAINRTRLYRVLDTVVQWQPDQLTVTLFHHPNDSIEVETHKLESERPFLEKAFQAKFVIKTEELKNG